MLQILPGETHLLSIALTLVLAALLLARRRRQAAKSVDGGQAADTSSSTSTTVCAVGAAPRGGGGGGDAATGPSWSRGYGRLKYTIFNSSSACPFPAPPKYSLVNLDLPMPAISPAEEAGLQRLAEKVADLREAGKRTDSRTLLRYLKARDGNVQLAEKFFRQSIAYRKQLKADEIDTTWNLAAYERCLAPWWARGGILGLSLKRKVVGWDRFGKSRFPELIKALPWEKLIRVDAVHLQRILASLEEHSMKSGEPLGDSILVIDLSDLDMSYYSREVVSAYGRLLMHRDMLLPSTLGHIFLICAPKWFGWLYKMAQSFLTKQTRDKVQIVSSREESLKLLRQHISDDVIPAYMGGKMHTNGDPNCSQILGSDGPLPRSALDRFFELVAKGGSEVQEEHEIPEPPSSGACVPESFCAKQEAAAPGGTLVESSCCLWRSKRLD